MKNTDDVVKEMKKVINETIRTVYELSQDKKTQSFMAGRMCKT